MGARSGVDHAISQRQLHRTDIRRIGPTVARTELIDRLRASRFDPLVLVFAPVGYGKTTLLAQWRARDRRPFAWVELAEVNDEPGALFRAVGTALEEAKAFSPRNGSGRSVSPSATRIAVRTTLSHLTRRVVIVLDDAQMVRDRKSIELVEVMAEALPAGNQLVLCGRGWPRASLAHLRGRLATVEIGRRELAMTPSESEELIRGKGIDPRNEVVGTLVGKIEGWPALLSLGSRSLGDDTDPRGSLTPSEISGGDRSIADYVWFEVLGDLKRDDVRFLERCSFLEDLSASFCDAVLDRTDSARRLARLEEHGGPIVALDHEGDRYRWHPLLRETLARRFEIEHPDDLPEFRRRASAWCERTGDVVGAIEHGVGAGDASLVASLLAKHGPGLYAEGLATTVDRWFRWLEEQGEAAYRPPIVAVLALLRANWGHPADAERWADIAARADATDPTPDGSTWASWLAVLRALMCRDGVADMASNVTEALDGLAGGSQLRGVAYVFDGVARYLTGDPQAAHDRFDDAAELGRKLGATNGVVVALAMLAALGLERGDRLAAQVKVDEAVAYLDEHPLDAYPTTALLHAVRARLAAQGADIEGARSSLARADRLRPNLTWSIPHLAVLTRLELASVHVALADPAGARAVLREADDILRRRPDLGMLGSRARDLAASIGTMGPGSVSMSSLTAAELRLLPFLPSHRSFREIGGELHLSPHTVKSQAISIYRKLGVSTRSEAVAEAQASGLLDE